MDHHRLRHRDRGGARSGERPVRRAPAGAGEEWSDGTSPPVAPISRSRRCAVASWRRWSRSAAQAEAGAAPTGGRRAAAGAGAGREADPDRDDREELDQPGVSVGAPRRRDRGQGAVGAHRRSDRADLADAAPGGRPDPGAADRPGGQRRGERDPDLLLRRRQGDGRDQRRGRARRAGHDVRQRRRPVEALRVLRRRRSPAGRGRDGRARQADRRQGPGRDPGAATRTRPTCAGGSRA